MRIVHAASEMFPYLKTGGLADAVAALTGALADRGHELAVFIPGYRSVLDGPHVAGAKASHKLKVEMGDTFLAGDVFTLNPRPGLSLGVSRWRMVEWFVKGGIGVSIYAREAAR